MRSNEDQSSFLALSDLHSTALVEPALQPVLQGWAAICREGREKTRQPVLEALETDPAKERNEERPGGEGCSAVGFALCPRPEQAQTQVRAKRRWAS